MEGECRAARGVIRRPRGRVRRGGGSEELVGAGGGDGRDGMPPPPPNRRPGRGGALRDVGYKGRGSPGSSSGSVSSPPPELSRPMIMNVRPAATKVPTTVW